MTSKTYIYPLMAMIALTACTQPNSDTASNNTPADTTNLHASTNQSVQNTDNTAKTGVATHITNIAQDKTKALGEKALQLHDVAALAQAVKRSGIQSDDAQKWQRQIEQATNEQEIKRVLKEQLNASNKLLSEVSKVNMRSQEGKRITQQLTDGTQKIQQATKQMLALDLTDPNLNSKIMPIMQQIYEGGQLNFAAMDSFLQMTKALGFASNEEAIQAYQQQKHLFETAIKQNVE